MIVPFRFNCDDKDDDVATVAWAMTLMISVISVISVSFSFFIVVHTSYHGGKASYVRVVPMASVG